jgi:hypothetical protein
VCIDWRWKSKQEDKMQDKAKSRLDIEICGTLFGKQRFLQNLGCLDGSLQLTFGTIGTWITYLHAVFAAWNRRQTTMQW